MHELFKKYMGGKSDGFLATGIIEVIYGDIETDKDR